MFYPQTSIYPQTGFYPQTSFYPQANFGPQSVQGAQGIQGPQAFQGPQAIQGPQGIQGVPYGGYPSQVPSFVQGLSQLSNWQHTAQQQPALQQQAMLPFLAHQLAAQQFATHHPYGMSGGTGLNPELTAGLLPQQPHHQLLQQLAQYHYLVAQQLARLAANQAVQGVGSTYAGQFIPGQPFIPGQSGTNFVPGITMH